MKDIVVKGYEGKSYTSPDFAILKFSSDDVITTSDWSLPVMPFSEERDTPGNIEYR